MKPRAAVAFVAVGVLWGSAWIPNSAVLRELPGMRAGAVRFAVAAAFACLLAWITRRVPSAKAELWSVLRTALILGTTALALPYVLTVRAAGQVSPGTVAVLFAFMPLAALLQSREVVSGAIPILVVGIGGVAFLVANGVSSSTAQISGALLILCSVVIGAFSLNYAKTHLRRSDLFISVAIQFAVAAALLAVVSVISEMGQPASWNPEAVVSLLVLGVVVSGSTLPAMYWLLSEWQSWQVASLQWTATLVAVVESAWFLRAKPSVEMWAGAAIISGGTIWLLRAGPTPATVTLQITNHTGEARASSESEVRSK